MNYLPAIKCEYSGNVRILYGDLLATAAVAKKYAQIEINRITAAKNMTGGDKPIALRAAYDASDHSGSYPAF